MSLVGLRLGVPGNRGSALVPGSGGLGATATAAFALGAGWVFEPQLRVGASVLYAPETTTAGGCDCVAHDGTWAVDASGGIDLAVAWAK